MTLRRAVAVVLAWAVTVGAVLVGVRATVALPERCPAVPEDRARAAVAEAVAWFERNQSSDGRWAYRYDRGADEVDRRDHVVRHSGVALSLYQADAAGFPDARRVADAGVEWSLDRLTRRRDWAAVRSGDEAPTGASALLVAALATRRLATGDDRWDDDMARLGRFLVTMTEESGAVLSSWDVAAGAAVPGRYSVFFTGEVYFALGLLDRVDPDGGWRPVADRIGRYLATERDDAEGRWPTTPDHWAAYGLDVAATPAGAEDTALHPAAAVAPDTRRTLDAAQRDYVRDLAPAFGVQVRWESQRTGSGLNRWVLRGVPGLGAAVGTLGEGLGGLWRATDGAPGFESERDAIGARLRCVAGLLVDRQVSAAEAADAGRPGLARGAWFRLDTTQMDDQQHALSALLAALPALAEGGPVTSTGTGEASAGRLVWLMAVALAVANPPRVRQALGAAGPPGAGVGVGRGAVVAGAGGVVLPAVVLAGLAAGAGPLARALDVSGTTALVAAGLVAGVTAALDTGNRPARVPWRRVGGDGGGGRDGGGAWEEGPRPGWAGVLDAVVVLRPGVVVLVLGVGAQWGPGVGAAAAVAAAAAGAAPLVRRRPWWRTGDRARVFVAVAALVGGIDLILHGILGT